MKTTILKIFLTCLVFPLFGQHKFLDVPKLEIKDLESAQYHKNPFEVAEILYKSYHYWIEYSGKLNLDVVYRVKVYKKDQAERFMNQEIITYNGNSNNGEKIKSLKVATYNLENGKVVQSRIENQAKYQSREYGDYTITKFAFENVKDGSVLECKYTITSPFNGIIDRMIIEDVIPSKQVEFVLDYPHYLGYNIDYKGSLVANYKEVGNKRMHGGDYRTYRYGYEGVAPYREEKFVKNIDNYRTTIRAELNSSNIVADLSNYGYGVVGGYKSYASNWNDIRKRLYSADYFGGQLQKINLVKDLLPQKIKDISNKEAKAEAILFYVQKNYVWNNYYTVGSNGKTLENLLETKIGSSGQINLLLIMLMRSAGLDANPIVLSTVERGILQDRSPTASQLNYVIACVYINGKPVFYDASSKMSTPNLLRPAAFNYFGYLMTDKEVKRLDIDPPGKSNTTIEIDAELIMDGFVKGRFYDKRTGLFAMLSQEQYAKDSIKYETANYKEKYKISLTNAKTKVINNFDFVTSFDFNSDSFIDTVSDKIIFNPLLFLYSEKHEFDQSDERKSPIEFLTGYDNTKKVTIELPEGYIFESIPTAKKFRTEDNSISYFYNVNQENNKLTVETILTVEEAVYPKEYYPSFKQIFDNISKMEGQVVTAVKK